MLVSELELGDQIQLWTGTGYGTATVYRIDVEAEVVHVWRPYIHTGDFSYGARQCIPYVGIEDFEIYMKTEVTRTYKSSPKL